MHIGFLCYHFWLLCIFWFSFLYFFFDATIFWWIKDVYIYLSGCLFIRLFDSYYDYHASSELKIIY